MSISHAVICSDLSENCLGRALVLAEVLAAFGPVKIVGPELGKGVWHPARSAGVAIHGVALSSSFGFFQAKSWLRDQLIGSRVIVTKPRSTSLGLALAAGVRPQQLLLDIDDWELGFMEPHKHGVARALALASRGLDLLAPRSLNSYWAIRSLDWACHQFPRRLVSNSWLKAKFGGVVVPHVRDTDELDPRKHAAERAAFRERNQLEGRPWVGFIGTIREHKGVEDLVAATAALQGEQAPGLLLAGVDFKHAFSMRILEQARELLPESRLRLVGAFDTTELPGWVSAVDIVCIPSRNTPGSWGQIPAKLFDAMSMARPVVASDVSDMGAILDGCGLTFPPGNVAALSQRLDELARNPSEGARLGERARARAVERFSVASAQRAVASLVAEIPIFEG